MKTIQQLSQCLSRATLVAALTGFMLLPISTLAQEKGAERLMKLNRPPAPPKQRVDALKTDPMSCPKCQDVTTRIPDLSAKGGAVLVAGGRPFKSVVQGRISDFSGGIALVNDRSGDCGTGQWWLVS